MRREVWIVVIVIITAILAGSVAWVAKPPETITETIRVGAPRPIPDKPLKIASIGYATGPGAVYYGPGLNGIEMIVDKINEEGGVLGRRINLIEEDEAGDVTEIVARLAEVEKVDLIVGSASSDKAMEIAAAAEDHGVIFFQNLSRTPLAVKDPETGETRKYVFKLNNTAASHFANPVRWIKNYHPEAETVAYIFQDYLWGHETKEYFDAARRALMPELEVVEELWPKPFAEDYTPYITTLEAADPDVIVTSFWGGDSLRFTEQGIAHGLFEDLLYIGYPGNFLTAGGETDLIPEIYGEVETGFGTSVVPGYEQWPGMKDFCKDYRERFGIYPTGGTSDGVASILAYTQAVEKFYKLTGSYPTTENIIDTLEGFTVKTPFGIRTIREEDHRTMQTEFVGQIAPSDDPSWRQYIYDNVMIFPAIKGDVPVWTATKEDIVEWIEGWEY